MAWSRMQIAHNNTTVPYCGISNGNEPAYQSTAAAANQFAELGLNWSL